MSLRDNAKAIERVLRSKVKGKKAFNKNMYDMEGYAIARQNGWMSANDIRALENLNPIPEEEGGASYLVNGNMIPINLCGIAQMIAAAAAVDKSAEEQEQPEEEPPKKSPQRRKKQKKEVQPDEQQESDTGKSV